MIQPVGEIVVVATLSSVFYVFDAVSAMELRRFDITSIIQPLGKRTGEIFKLSATVWVEGQGGRR